MLTAFARAAEKGHGEVIIRSRIRAAGLVTIHKDRNSHGAGVNFRFAARAAHFLPTMATSLVAETLNILAGNSRTSIGEFDGVQSTLAVEILRVGSR